MAATLPPHTCLQQGYSIACAQVRREIVTSTYLSTDARPSALLIAEDVIRDAPRGDSRLAIPRLPCPHDRKPLRRRRPPTVRAHHRRFGTEPTIAIPPRVRAATSASVAAKKPLPEPVLFRIRIRIDLDDATRPSGVASSSGPT